MQCPLQRLLHSPSRQHPLCRGLQGLPNLKRLHRTCRSRCWGEPDVVSAPRVVSTLGPSLYHLHTTSTTATAISTPSTEGLLAHCSSHCLWVWLRAASCMANHACPRRRSALSPAPLPCNMLERTPCAPDWSWLQTMQARQQLCLRARNLPHLRCQAPHIMSPAQYEAETGCRHKAGEAATQPEGRKPLALPCGHTFCEPCMAT